MGDHHGRKPINRLQTGRGEHRARGSMRSPLAVLHDHDAIGVFRGEVQIVEHHPHGGSGGGFLPNDPQHMASVARVEGRGRLIEKQCAVGPRRRRVRPGLNEHAGQVDPLLLTAGEAMHRAVGESPGTDPIQRTPGQIGIVAPTTGLDPASAVGNPAEQYHFEGGQFEGDPGALAEHPATSGEVGRRDPGQTASAGTNLAARGTEPTGQARQQGRLPRPVGTDDGEDLAALQLEVHPVQDVAS